MASYVVNITRSDRTGIDPVHITGAVSANDAAVAVRAIYARQLLDVTSVRRFRRCAR
jgi:hypothetical protein